MQSENADYTVRLKTIRQRWRRQPLRRAHPLPLVRDVGGSSQTCRQLGAPKSQPCPEADRAGRLACFGQARGILPRAPGNPMPSSPLPRIVLSGGLLGALTVWHLLIRGLSSKSKVLPSLFVSSVTAPG